MQFMECSWDHFTCHVDDLTKGTFSPLVIGTGYNRKAFPWYTAPAKQPEKELTSEAGGVKTTWHPP